MGPSCGAVIGGAFLSRRIIARINPIRKRRCAERR